MPFHCLFYLQGLFNSIQILTNKSKRYEKDSVYYDDSDVNAIM